MEIGDGGIKMRLNVGFGLFGLFDSACFFGVSLVRSVIYGDTYLFL